MSDAGGIREPAEAFRAAMALIVEDPAKGEEKCRHPGDELDEECGVGGEPRSPGERHGAEQHQQRDERQLGSEESDTERKGRARQRSAADGRFAQ